MSRFTQRRDRTGVCPLCGDPVAVDVVLVARTKAGKAITSRSKRMCEPCGERVFVAMEHVLDHLRSEAPR